jgi:hypothetical protein
MPPVPLLNLEAHILIISLQRRHSRPDRWWPQRLQPVERALGALVSHAPARGACRIPLPEHPLQELPLGRW